MYVYPDDGKESNGDSSVELVKHGHKRGIIGVNVDNYETNPMSNIEPPKI